MGLDDFISLPVWKKYSKKAADKIVRPANWGFFLEEDAAERNMRLVIGNAELAQDGSRVLLYWLVDSEDGMIVDSKFQVFGPSSLIAALDAACDLLAGKNLSQAKRLSAELIDKQLRDKSDTPAFPEEVLAHVNLVIEAIEKAIDACSDIPLSHTYVSPVPRDLHGDRESSGYPGWLDLSKEQKLSILESLFNEEIRPYIELDSGGIEIMDLIGDKELIISYSGACTSCYSSVGSTLSTIQQIVQDKIHPELIVVPNLDDLQL